MTTIDSTTRPAVLGDGAIGSFSAAVADWATSTDHKKIGRLFAGCGLVSLAGYAVLGLLLALERAAASETVLPENSLVQLFQAHRIGMIFDGLLPLTLGLAIAVVPMQLGARSIAFARLALTSFYLWLGGIVLIGISLIGNGGINGGNAQMVDLFLAGHGLMLLGLIAAAVSVATTVLTTRAPGMTMRRIPFLSWAALVQALGMLIALPVMFGMVVYLFIDLRNASLVFSGPDAIGDELGAFLTQPLTFVFALTAIGVLAEVAPVAFGRRHPLRQVVFAGLALVGVGAFASVALRSTFLVDFGGASEDIVPDLVLLGVFLGLPLLGALIVLLLVGAVARGAKPRLTSPLIFSTLGTLMILVGMLGTVLHSVADLELVGTVFEEAALVYVVYGALLAGIGGLIHWSPKLSGRIVAERKVLPLAGLGLIATVLASFPHYIAGFLGQPASAGVYSGVDGAGIWNTAVLAGHGLMALTVLASIVAMVTGERAEPSQTNHWCAHTLEWTLPSPAPADNFAALPTVTSAEPELDQTPMSEGSNS